jgi:DNA-binding NtrC family response regulator
MNPADQTAARVLFIDDDQDVLEAGALLLRRNGFDVATVPGPDEAWSAMASAPPDAILLDLNFSPGARSGDEGLACLGRILSVDPDAVVAVLTGHSGVNIAVAAMRAGAHDFIMKPWKNDRLVSVVTDSVALHRQRRAGPKPAVGPPVLLGRSPAIERLRAQVERLAQTDAPALLCGEPGAGKMLAARAVHAASARRAEAFVSIDLSGLSGPAQDSRLFGPADGAVARAAGGTLYLKAAEQLARPVQDRLADLLAREVLPVRLLAGAPEPASLDGWREDLRHTLGAARLMIAPLRARRGDIIPLAEHFVRLEERQTGAAAKQIGASAEAFLAAQPWPGNARELRAAAAQAVLICDCDHYRPQDFQGTPTEQVDGAPDGGDLNLDRAERRLIEAALTRHRHNVSHAARDLGITRAALYRRMDKHGL